MGRPADRTTLLARVDSDYETLLSGVDRVPSSKRSQPGACEDWSVKDILAHLDAWHGLFLEWERVGRAGHKSPLPADGYSWKETPALNTAIWERARDDFYDAVTARLSDSHGQVRSVVAAYTEAELFEKARYTWTGSTSVGSYAVSATTSHYDWATKLIRRFGKTIASSS
jgi:hypothetical protein